MNEWKFYLQKPSSVEMTEIEEPVGWTDVKIKMTRDAQWHGINFEFSTQQLGFYSVGGDIITQEYDTFGLAANLTIIVTLRCQDNVDFEEFYRGRLSFGSYKKKCGEECLIYIGVEQLGCMVQLRNSYDTKVDVKRKRSANNISTLPNYSSSNYFGKSYTIPPKASRVGWHCKTDTDRDSLLNPYRISDVDFDPNIGVPNFNGFHTLHFPLNVETLMNIGDAVPIPDWQLFSDSSMTQYLDDVPDKAIPYQFEVGGLGTCQFAQAELNYRVKGYVTFKTKGIIGSSNRLRFVIYRVPNGQDPNDNASWEKIVEPELGQMTGVPVTITIPFDVSVTNMPITLNQGDKYYVTMLVNATYAEAIDWIDVYVSPSTFVSFSTVKTCADSTSQMFFAHELLDMVIRHNTNGCLALKSDFFGRVDSMGKSYSTDGCGAGVAITNGLFLRKAPEANLFISLQQLWEGLNPIFNLGMGLERDEFGFEQLAVEEYGYFYSNTPIMVLDGVPSVETVVAEELHYANINIGYEKFTTEDIFGLDEFNSTRQYRTTLDTVGNNLEIISKFIAGTYAIEKTRTQSFVITTAADTEYDNDNFIIFMHKSGANYLVETGADCFADATKFEEYNSSLNLRITPVRNLLRWFKTIAASYRNPYNTLSKLFFASGESNYLASGRLTTGCILEKSGQPIAENQDIGLQDFNEAENGVPKLKNEYVSFKYPMSVKEFNLVRQKPYGYISYQCGTGDYEGGYIKELTYSPVEGMAEFVLLKRFG